MGTRRERLTARREVLGYTQEAFAHEVGVEPSTVGRWERGALSPQPWRRRKIATTLKVDLDQLAELLGEAVSASDAVEPARSAPGARSLDTAPMGRELLGAAAALAVGAVPPDLARWLPADPVSAAPAPRRIGQSDVAQIRELTALLWSLEQNHGGGAALDAASGALATARSLLSVAEGMPVAEHARIAVADLHCLVGWSLHDVGRHNEASRHFMAALALGSEVGEAGMVAAALYRLGRVSLHVERPDDALRAFQLGQIAAQDAGSYADLARLHVSSGWAHALKGQTRRMEDSFSRAEHELGRIDGDAPPWASAFARSGDWDGVRAMAYMVLARRPEPEFRHYAADAATIAHRIISAPTTGRPARSSVFDRIILAAGKLHVGDVDAGIAEADSAIDLVASLRSVRAVDRLTDIERAARTLPRDAAGHLLARIAELRAV